jgi:hypothetical protein
MLTGNADLLPLQDSLFRMINYIDRFLSLKYVSSEGLTLVVIAAQSIAARYDGELIPGELLKAASSTHDIKTIRKAEAYMLQTLKHDLN